MIPVQYVFVFIALIAMPIVWTLIEMHRRQRRSWEQIAVRMSPECRLAYSSERSDRCKLAVAVWANSPRVAFRDAGVLMEVADYAERNAADVAPSRLRDFRTAVIELRLAAAGAILRRALLR